MQSSWFYAVGSIAVAACGGATGGGASGSSTNTGGAPSAITGGTVGAGGVVAGGAVTGGAVLGGWGGTGSVLATGGYQTVPGCCPNGCTERCSAGTWRTCGVAPTDSQWIIQSCHCDGSGWGKVEFRYGSGSSFYLGSGGCSGDGSPYPGGAANHSRDSGPAHSADADASSGFDASADVSVSP
jgi:hypothetical protein